MEMTVGTGQKRRNKRTQWTRKKRISKPVSTIEKKELWENALEDIYLNVGQAGAYSSSPQKLQKILLDKHNIHTSLSQIKKWLKTKYSHSIHTKANLSFKRNPIIATDIDEQWQGDLFFLEEFQKANKGFKGGLLVIDVVSRKMFVELMKNKTGPATTEAFKIILHRSAPRKPMRLQTDKGTEFLNQTFQNFLKQNDIDFFTSHSDHKAAIAERAIKTLKVLIYKYLDENNTFTYNDKIQALVDTYNNTFHSTIKMAPSEVKKENVGNVLENLYSHIWKSGDRLKLKKQKFKSGDFVRLSKIHDETFKKGYKGHWTEEIFQIDKIKNTSPFYTYGIKDLSGKEIFGSYYEEELQKIPEIDFRQHHWKIEKIIKNRTTKSGRKEYFVKWVNYDESFNSWVPDNKMKSIAAKG
jgi:transposase InsO family protein